MDCDGGVEGEKVGVAFLNAQCSEGQPDGDVVDGMGFGRVGDGGVWDGDFDWGAHLKYGGWTMNQIGI